MTDQMTLPVPDPRSAQCFNFRSCEYDPASGVARLSWSFDEGPELVEQIEFPYAPWPPEASRQAAFQNALQILHLIAGVSYYKAGLSPSFSFANPESALAASGFLKELYVQGLAEFAFRNELDISGRIRFPALQDDVPGSARPLVMPDRALVAMGGGKDSLVGLDLLQKAGVEVQPVCVGSSTLIADTVRAAGLPLIRINRTLAPELKEMNRSGAWNGHVPVTAINSAILVCAAILYGYRHVVFANERSADEATLISGDGREINHQYSKGSAFEAAFRALVHSRISPDIEYFSILRPFSEIGIVRHFSKLQQFHGVYSSCNRNFHLDGPRVLGRWCGDCPKCRFAALSLALFVSPGEVMEIQGVDLLNQADQANGFRELCGLGRDKPFECVGEAGESRAAMLSLAGKPEWAGHAVVMELLPELECVESPTLDTLLRASPEHFIPAELFQRLQIEGCP